MDFDHDKDHIVRHPGGVILHMKDGTSENFAYGQRVPTEDLADYQLATIDRHTDQTQRSEYLEKPAVESQAHKEAAFADGGQVNSTSDPVPSNYAELSEDDAAQLVLALQNDPQIQARIILHERVACGGRRKVVDAATDVARSLADTLFGLAVDGHTTFDQTRGPFDAEREAERESRRAQERERGPAKQQAPVPQQSQAQQPEQRETPQPQG